MKIVFFMNHADEGGAALALIDLILEIKKCHPDYQLLVVTGKKNKINQIMEDLGIENYSAPFRNFVSGKHYPQFIWRFLLRMRHDILFPIAVHMIEDKVDFSTVDIVHTNLNRVDVGAFLAKKYNIPHIWHLREHREGGLDKISIFKDDIKYMNKFPSSFVAISNSVKNEWIRAGISENKMNLIYDGIDQSRIITKKNRELSEEKNIIKVIFLGGYDVAKGQEQLILAMSHLDRNYLKWLKVDFYGNGQKKYRRYLQELINKYKLNSYINLKAYDAKIYSDLCNYDVGMNCSRKEGFGRVTVEYMMAGLCVIASDSGANEEIVIHNETGFIYPYGNIDKLSETLRRIIRKRDIISEMGNNAKKWANQNFTMKIHEESIISMYSAITKHL